MHFSVTELVLIAFIAIVLFGTKKVRLAPSLYRHERRLLIPLLFGSNLLVYTGFAFAYWVVLPLIFRFMVGTLPAGVSMATDISSYLDFVLAFIVGMLLSPPDVLSQTLLAVPLCLLFEAGLLLARGWKPATKLVSAEQPP